MRIKLQRVWSKKLENHKEILRKYNYKIHESDSAQYAVIEVNDAEDIFTLSKDFAEDLIVRSMDDKVLMYVDYID